MEPSLARYIWTHTKKQQLWILMIVVLSMVPYFMSFDLPKLIVNGPIQGKGFEQVGATQPFMRLIIACRSLATSCSSPVFSSAARRRCLP